jgi:gamma-glutamyl phosphate reductase
MTGALWVATSQKRIAILHRVAESLLASEEEILAANEKDISMSANKIDNTLMQRLKLRPSKLQASTSQHISQFPQQVEITQMQIET